MDRVSLRCAAVALLACSVLAAAAASASAVIVHPLPGKTLSYQPLRGAVRPFDQFFSNLDYNGGPVMPSNTNYAFYWAPSGAPAYPADYQPGLNRYFEDLAHDSGGTENVDSISPSTTTPPGSSPPIAPTSAGPSSTPVPIRPTAAPAPPSA